MVRDRFAGWEIKHDFSASFSRGNIQTPNFYLAACIADAV